MFTEVAAAIKEAESLLQKRAVDLKPESGTTWSPESHERDTVALFLIRSLNRYTRTLSYVSDCTMSNDPEVHYFALPQIRTLTDIYSKILYLAHCSNEVRTKTCIAYQVHTASKIANELLIEVLQLHKKYLDTYELSIPNDKDQVWKWYQNSGLQFESNNKVLTSERMGKFAVETLDIFKAKDWYAIFAHISEIVHGNPFYHDKPHNERFWVATMALSTSAYTIELIDRFYLEKVKPRDYREWLQKVKVIQPQLQELWQKRLS